MERLWLFQIIRQVAKTPSCYLHYLVVVDVVVVPAVVVVVVGVVLLQVLMGHLGVQPLHPLNLQLPHQGHLEHHKNS